MKCLIIDAVHSSIAEEFSKYMQVDTHMLPTQEELAKLIPDYDVLIMRVDPAINKEILDAAKNLKVIGVCSVGLNHIDLDTAKEKGIQVINAPGLNGNAVAELTIAKMLDIARHTIPACYDVKVNKNWDKYKFVGSELRGKTLGILGFGRIGQRVGELARAFKMDVVAYDPYLPAHVFEEQHAKSLSIDEVLKVSDYVTIHMPLTDETKNLFNAKSIAEMKDGAVVLNMARGGIVNEKDMYEALKAGKLGGYGSDVMENELAAGGLTEGAGFDSPLFECDNFIVTPHLGAQTVDASRDIGAHIIAKVKEARKIVLPVGNHTIMIPAYATAKEVAKDFVRYLATDGANNVFMEYSNGASMPFNYDVETEDPELYNSLAQIQKDRISLCQGATYLLNENTYKTVYYGGIARVSQGRTVVEALFTAQNEKDRMSAQEIYDAEIAYWDDVRFANVLTNSGITN